ncbi:MAG TPA: type II toxin-antitoxin system HicA family toxin [Frankiaceae bacterium]|nr:type II toxin-antitoxin system HicA family toxin [Frankiaceae bacterium]
MKVSAVVGLLERGGWRLVRTKGSHRQFGHPSKPGRVTVAGEPSATLTLGVEASILKQAGLRRLRRIT